MLCHKLKPKHMKNKIKILVIIATAALFIRWLVPQVFLANSPRINPLFLAKLKGAPSYIASLSTNFLNSLSKKEKTAPPVKVLAVSKDEAEKAMNSLQKVTPPPNALFKVITTKVSAAETGKKNEIILKIDKGAKYSVSKLVLPDGREMKIIRISN